MKICTAAQMARIDAETIAAGTPGLELMERAGEALTDVLLDFLHEKSHPHDHGGCGHGGCDHGEADAPDSVLILCGKGNNGGDGLVMARLLQAEGLAVGLLLLAKPGDLSPDAAVNLTKLPPEVSVVQVPADQWVDAFEDLSEDADVVVDAIFGTGITPPLRPPHAALIRALNDTGLPCLAVDIPSGINGDDGGVDPVAVAADITATVGLPKCGLLLAPGRDFCGELVTLDIGFPPEIVARHTDNLHLLEREDYLALLPARPTAGHKYDNGTLLAVAGSRAFGGAAYLTGLGALRSGVGLLTLAVPTCLETSLRTGLPEAVLAPLAQTESGTLAAVDPAARDALLTRQRALAVGPGLGADPATDAWIADLAASVDRPLVLDADGLGAFARQDRAPTFKSTAVVLTPHAGELSRLAGLTSAEVLADRFTLCADLARRWNVVLMLKGAPSLIAAPDGRVFINPTGDDALARGGSGDVLTGLVGGLLAQGATALDAALLGAYILGLAGTRAARNQSTRSVLVRETAAAIGPIFAELEKEASSSAELRERIWPVNGGDGS